MQISDFIGYKVFLVTHRPLLFSQSFLPLLFDSLVVSVSADLLLLLRFSSESTLNKKKVNEFLILFLVLNCVTYKFCENIPNLGTLGNDLSALRIGSVLLKNLRVWFFIKSLKNKHFIVNIMNFSKSNVAKNSSVIELTKDKICLRKFSSLDSLECSLYSNRRKCCKQKRSPCLCFLVLLNKQI